MHEKPRHFHDFTYALESDGSTDIYTYERTHQHKEMRGRIYKHNLIELKRYGGQTLSNLFATIYN